MAVLGTIVASFAACSASASGRLETAGATTSPPAPITVTSATDCEAGGVRHPVYTFPLREDDNGNRHLMVPCQVVNVLLLHATADGCAWRTVQSSAPDVMAIDPLPLPAPPPGGTVEDYRAVAPGQAALTSSLACPNAAPEATWRVDIEVVA